jgi:hypothetical protein
MCAFLLGWEKSGNEHGEWLVEPAELFRVYPTAPQRGGTDATQSCAAAALEVEVICLKQVADLLRQELSDVRNDRDHWRDTATVEQCGHCLHRRLSRHLYRLRPNQKAQSPMKTRRQSQRD